MEEEQWVRCSRRSGNWEDKDDIVIQSRRRKEHWVNMKGYMKHCVNTKGDMCYMLCITTKENLTNTGISVCQIQDEQWQFWQVRNFILLQRVLVPERTTGNLKVNFNTVKQGMGSCRVQQMSHCPTEQYGSSTCGGPGTGPFDNQVPKSVALSRKDTAHL